MTGKRARCVLLLVLSLGLGGERVEAGVFTAESREALDAIEHRLRAAHFLSMATFGPRGEDIDPLADRIGQIGEHGALSEWIDEQFALPPTGHESAARDMIADDGFDRLDPEVPYRRYRDSAWWHNAVRAPDQLRQRMAWALSQIFVVNEFHGVFSQVRADASGEPQYLGLLDYYDTLVAGAFGNYRELLSDVALHPVMGVFLGHVRNRMADPMRGSFPDENFARELLQLFSIGPYALRYSGVVRTRSDGTPIETYDNDTVEAFARVFTGLGFRDSTSFTDPEPNLHDPMLMVEEFHDPEAKALLGGAVVPAGQPGLRDVQDALDNVFQHENVPPFIARRLIQRFVMSNPPAGYIRRVAEAFSDDGSGVRGSFRAVLRALLLDHEARGTQRYARFRRPWRLLVLPGGTEASRLREPVLRYTAFLRAFEASSDHPSGRLLFSGNRRLDQLPFRARDVFNYYSPDHRPAGEISDHVPSAAVPNGELVAPELEIFTTSTANQIANLFRSDVRHAEHPVTLLDDEVHGRITTTIRFDFSDEIALAADSEALLDRLDLLLCHGTLRQRSARTIARILVDETSVPTLRAKGAILAVLTASDCAVDG